MAKIQSQDEERKSQESFGKHINMSKYDKRRESEEKKLKGVEPEFDIEAFIEQQKDKGKTAGHIYFELQLRNLRKDNEEELKSSYHNKECPKTLDNIQNILDNTNTYGDFTHEFEKYKNSDKENKGKILSLEWCYGVPFRNLLWNIANKSKSAQNKQFHALFDLDKKDDQSFDQLYKDVSQKPRKIAKKGLRTQLDVEQKSILDRFDIKEHQAKEESRFNFGNQYVTDKLQKTFGLRSGQVGVSVPDSEEERFLKLVYGSFYDLADATNLEPEEIGLGKDPKEINPKMLDENIQEILEENHNLAIAFGARGSGKAKAHYEPAFNVINITRSSGNGSIAHEWGHALDKALGKGLTHTSTNFSELTDIYPKDYNYKDTEDTNYRSYVLSDLKYKVTKSPFCTGIGIKGRKTIENRKGEERTSKSDYFSNPKECFARSFESYVQDKLDIEGKPNYFLVLPNKSNNPDSAVAKVYPQGKDREEINHLFDKMFKEQQRLKKLITK